MVTYLINLLLIAYFLLKKSDKKNRPCFQRRSTLKTNLNPNPKIFCSALQAHFFTLYVLRSTLYALRSTLYALRFTLYALRFTLYSLRFTLYALRFTLYALRYQNLYPSDIPKPVFLTDNLSLNSFKIRLSFGLIFIIPNCVFNCTKRPPAISNPAKILPPASNAYPQNTS